MDRICRRFDDLISSFQISEYLNFTIHRLSCLHIHPLRFAISYSYDKRVLLVSSHCRSRDKERGIGSVDGPENGSEATWRELAVGIRGIEFDGHRSRLVVHLMGDAFDRSLEDLSRICGHGE